MDIALSLQHINFFMGKSFKTFLKHTAKDFHNHSVNPPVVRASTILFKTMQELRKFQNHLVCARKMFFIIVSRTIVFVEY